jgi:mRNA interferase MazF
VPDADRTNVVRTIGRVKDIIANIPLKLFKFGCIFIVVWTTLDPQAGHEQSGRRPALVLSPSAYNSRVGLALFCPITSHVKGYPFEVILPAGSPVSGVVGADQVKSLEWRARKAARIGPLSEEVVAQVLQRLQTLLAD